MYLFTIYLLPHNINCDYKMNKIRILDSKYTNTDRRDN
jgi:hypothetical protein